MDENLTPRERLKAWRDERGLSQKEAGAMIGVSGPAWCEWENGGRAPVEHRAALEVLTGIPASDWATDREREAMEKARASVAKLARPEECETPPTEAA